MKRLAIASVILLATAGCTLETSATETSTTAASSAVVATTPTTVPTSSLPRSGVYGLFDISPLVQTAESGVVAVTQDQVITDFLGNTQEIPAGAGTGVVIDDQGHILTNFHVIQNAAKVTVTASDGKARPATVVTEAPLQDLAVLEVEDTTGLVPLPLGDSDTIEVGDAAIAIGNALALNASEPTVSLGIISALHRQVQTELGNVENAIQTDAAINPGNSGGPLLNASGQVIGINTAIAGNAQNVGFAIPINNAKLMLDRFQRGVGQPYLGVSVADNSQAAAEQLNLSIDTGALLTQISPGDAADQAGLQQYDVVVAFNGLDIANASDLVDAINQTDPGQQVEIEYVRGDAHDTVTVTVGQRPPA
jgi:serine protease Do